MTLHPTQLRRRRWLAAGLTTHGKERKNKQHPELAGLTGAAYGKAYMKKQRQQDREGYNTLKSDTAPNYPAWPLAEQ